MTKDTIVRVDPKTLLVGPNVRTQVELGEGFLGSIRELGIRTPITAVETPEGLVVIDGQRRTLAAVDVGLELVPVFVTAEQTAEERIVDQVVVNEHRAGITESEAIAAVQELALFDLAVPAIAKKMGLREKFVDRAVKVGSSAAAKKAIEEHNLRFDTAVVIAEFDAYPEQQKQLVRLVQKGESWNVDSKAREFRDARQSKAVTAEIKKLGLVVVKEPDYSTNNPKSLDRLYTDQAKRKPLADLPHEKIVELAGDGLCAYPTFSYIDGERTCVIGYAIDGWKGRGLFGYEHTSSSSAPATPEDAEKLKQERRVARENTKAWVAASPARIEFLQALVARKTMPKGWEKHVIGRMLAGDSHGSGEWRMAGTILRAKDAKDSYSLRDSVVKHLAAHPATALQVGLATWAGSIEGGYEFDRKGWSQAVAKPYLLQLEEWGHTLSEVERRVAGKRLSKAAIE